MLASDLTAGQIFRVPGHDVFAGREFVATDRIGLSIFGIGFGKQMIADEPKTNPHGLDRQMIHLGLDVELV